MELSEEIKELKEYKENNDLTIADLARKIEADDTTVGRWLKGKYTPSLESKYKIRKFLKSAKESQQTELLQDELIDESELKDSERYLELVKGVERWAKDSNLDKLDPYKQYIKVVEEQGKLSEATSNLAHDKLNLKISVGYYQVQLIVYCLIRGLKFKEYIEEKFESEIRDNKVTVESPHPNPILVFTSLVTTMRTNSDVIKYFENGNEDKELYTITKLLLTLKFIADEYDTSLEETLEAVYKRIR